MFRMLIINMLLLGAVLGSTLDNQFGGSKITRKPVGSKSRSQKGGNSVHPIKETTEKSMYKGSKTGTLRSRSGSSRYSSDLLNRSYEAILFKNVPSNSERTENTQPGTLRRSRSSRIPAHVLRWSDEAVFVKKFSTPQNRSRPGEVTEKGSPILSQRDVLTDVLTGVGYTKPDDVNNNEQGNTNVVKNIAQIIIPNSKRNFGYAFAIDNYHMLTVASNVFNVHTLELKAPIIQVILNGETISALQVLRNPADGDLTTSVAIICFEYINGVGYLLVPVVRQSFSDIHYIYHGVHPNSKILKIKPINYGETTLLEGPKIITLTMDCLSNLTLTAIQPGLPVTKASGLQQVVALVVEFVQPVLKLLVLSKDATNTENYQIFKCFQEQTSNTSNQAQKCDLKPTQELRVEHAREQKSGLRNLLASFLGTVLYSSSGEIPQPSVPVVNVVSVVIDGKAAGVGIAINKYCVLVPSNLVLEWIFSGENVVPPKPISNYISITVGLQSYPVHTVAYKSTIQSCERLQKGIAILIVPQIVPFEKDVEMLQNYCHDLPGASILTLIPIGQSNIGEVTQTVCNKMNINTRSSDLAENPEIPIEHVTVDGQLSTITRGSPVMKHIEGNWYLVGIMIGRYAFQSTMMEMVPIKDTDANLDNFKHIRLLADNNKVEQSVTNLQKLPDVLLKNVVKVIVYENDSVEFKVVVGLWLPENYVMVPTSNLETLHHSSSNLSYYVVTHDLNQYEVDKLVRIGNMTFLAVRANSYRKPKADFLIDIPNNPQDWSQTYIYTVLPDDFHKYVFQLDQAKLSPVFNISNPPNLSEDQADNTNAKELRNEMQFDSPREIDSLVSDVNDGSPFPTVEPLGNIDMVKVASEMSDISPIAIGENLNDIKIEEFVRGLSDDSPNPTGETSNNIKMEKVASNVSGGSLITSGELSNIIEVEEVAHISDSPNNSKIEAQSIKDENSSSPMETETPKVISLSSDIDLTTIPGKGLTSLVVEVANGIVTIQGFIVEATALGTQKETPAVLPASNSIKMIRVNQDVIRNFVQSNYKSADTESSKIKPENEGKSPTNIKRKGVITGKPAELVRLTMEHIIHIYQLAPEQKLMGIGCQIGTRIVFSKPRPNEDVNPNELHVLKKTDQPRVWFIHEVTSSKSCLIYRTSSDIGHSEISVPKEVITSMSNVYLFMQNNLLGDNSAIIYAQKFKYESRFYVDNDERMCIMNLKNYKDVPKVEVGSLLVRIESNQIYLVGSIFALKEENNKAVIHFIDQSVLSVY